MEIPNAPWIDWTIEEDGFLNKTTELLNEKRSTKLDLNIYGKQRLRDNFVTKKQKQQNDTTFVQYEAKG